MQNMHSGLISEIERHLQKTENLADIFHEHRLTEKTPPETLAEIIHVALIRDRGYTCLSFNLTTAVPRWQTLHETAASGDGFDTVIAYHKSVLDLFLINPLKIQHWEEAGTLVPCSLIVGYTCAVPDRDTEREALHLQEFRSICTRNPLFPPVDRPHSELPPPERHAIRATTRYAVPVTNEFFHYGNVEAWRNIIESYQKKYSHLKVEIFYREKPVYRIGSLFKWGKVNVGDAIHFSVVGPEFKDVAKLKKYLTMGASPRFMPFIKKNVNTSLTLF
ncbi:MAG: hypothetical protein ABIK68_07300 [bacterium]